MSKKISVRLSSSTPLQALEAKARRAYAISEAERKAKKSVKKQPKAARIPDIERKVMSIIKFLENRQEEGCSVVKEEPGNLSSAYCILKVYSPWRRRATGAVWSSDAQGGRRLEQIYAIYADATNPKKLGSIAIYCDDSAVRATLIRQMGSLCGIPVRSVSIRMGIRPFVDVRLRA